MFLIEVDFVDVVGHEWGVVCFGAGEGAEGLEGLHDEVIEDFGVLLW